MITTVTTTKHDQSPMHQIYGVAPKQIYKQQTTVSSSCKFLLLWVLFLFILLVCFVCVCVFDCTFVVDVSQIIIKTRCVQYILIWLQWIICNDESCRVWVCISKKMAMGCNSIRCAYQYANKHLGPWVRGGGMWVGPGWVFRNCEVAGYMNCTVGLWVRAWTARTQRFWKRCCPNDPGETKLFLWF